MGTARLTLTTLSQPAETMTGMTGLGENRTHETLRYVSLDILPRWLP